MRRGTRCKSTVLKVDRSPFTPERAFDLIDNSGRFLGGWRLNATQLNNVLTRGSL
jgi:hypothetical protein